MTDDNTINLWSTALLGESQQSPFDFMQEQGEVLREQTGGRLWGEVKFFIGEDGITYHEFRIASQRLGDYRCLLLRTAHAKHVYPLYIYDYSQSEDALRTYEYASKTISDLLKPLSMMNTMNIMNMTTTVATKSEQGKYFAPPPDFVADDFREFKNQFAMIIQSKGTRAIVQSLLIQSNGQAD